MADDPGSSNSKTPGSEPGDGGASPSPGAERKPYAKNVREMLLRSLDTLGGEAFLVRLAQDNPKAYASLLAKCIPQAVEVSGEDGAPIAIYFPPL